MKTIMSQQISKISQWTNPLKQTVLIFCLGISLSYHPFAQAKENHEQFLDGIAAVVNDQIILISDVNERTQATLKALQAKNIDVPNIQALRLKVLDKIILERLQQERIKQLGLSVSDEEVLAQIQDIAKRNHLTVLQLRDQLNFQSPNGFKTFRKQIKAQMLIQKLRQVEVISKTQVTEGEINNYLKRKSLQNHDTQYHIQQIMLSLPEGSTPKQRAEVKAKATALLKRVKEGENFSQLAVRYSNGPKALDGGDLGWHGMDSIPAFFSQAVLQLKPNQVSPLIQSPIGFHIIKLLGKRQKGSKLVKQYNLYKFIILSDKALSATHPPKALVDLAKNIHSLKDFHQLNQRYSDIPASVNQNGHLGWKTLNDLPVKIARAVINMPYPKMAANPIATARGWEIIYLDGIRDQDLNLTNKRAAAMKTLRMQKANQSYAIWLRRLKEAAIIDNRLLDKNKMAQTGAQE